MPPENKQRDDVPAPERRPSEELAGLHTAQTTTIVGPDAVTGTASNARRRYAHAVEMCRAAIAERARAAAEVGIDGGATDSALELVRGQLVAEVNAIVDHEARRHASVRRLAVAMTSRRPR